MTDPAPQAQPTKPLVASTTFQGLAVIVVGQLVAAVLAHYHVAIPGLGDQITSDIVSYGISGAGIVMAAIGRYTATHKISGIFKAK